VFYVACGSALIAFGIGVLLAVLAAWLFTSDILFLGLLFAAWVPISVVSAVYHGIMVRQDKLIPATVTLLLGEFAGLVITVWTLLSGYGLFALAIGRIAQQVIHLLAGMVFTKARPRRGIERTVLNELLGYYWQLVSSRFLVNVSSNFVTYIIGAFLGAAAVGYFRAAIRLASALLEVIGESTRLLSWAVFGRATRDASDVHAAIRDAANTFYPVLYAISVPLFLALAIVAEDVTIGLLGDQWAPAAYLVAILAFSQFLTIPAFVTETLLSMTGAVSRLPMALLIVAITSVVLTLVAAPFGVVAVALSQVALQAVFFATHFWLQSRYGGVSLSAIARGSWKATVLALGLAAVLYLVDRSGFAGGLHPLLRAVLLCSAFGLVYLAALYVLVPKIGRVMLDPLRRRRV